MQIERIDTLIFRVTECRRQFIVTRTTCSCQHRSGTYATPCRHRLALPPPDAAEQAYDPFAAFDS